VSNIGIKDSDDAVRRIDVFQRTEGADTVEMQAIVVVNPTTGDPLLPDATGAMPVSAAALPLPAGAATQTTLAAVQSAVDALNAKVTAVNTGSVVVSSAPTTPVTGAFYQATQPVSIASMPTTPVTGAFFQATQPVSVAALPLPAGAATQATLASVQSAVDALNAKVTAVNTGAVVVSSAPTTAVTGAFYQATQPVSFTWAGLTDAQLRATAVPVSVAALPLPAGAATQATLAAVQSAVDALNAKVTAVNTGAVVVSSAPTTAVTGAFYQATQPVSFTWAGLTDAQLRATAVPVSAASLPLPTGAATEATAVAVGAAIVAAVEAIPGGGGGGGSLTDAELRATPVPMTEVGELLQAIEALRMTVHSLSRSIGLLMPDTSGRMRTISETGSTVAVSALPTLAAVTTVSTVSNQTNVGGFAANGHIPSLMHLSADSLRRNITVS
jgi:hypothetical protein